MQHHIILISVDALRADRLGCYGYQHNVSPNIDGLMRESLLFLRASAPATWTLPSHMSMLSGLEPLVHGCVSSNLHYPPETLPFPLAFELLEGKGYAPQVVVGGGYVEPEFGFGRKVKNFQVIHPIKEAVEATVKHARSCPLTFTFLHTYMVHDYPRVTTQWDPFRFLRQRDPDYEGYFPTTEDFPALLRALSVSPDAPTLPQRDVSYLDDLYRVAVLSMDRSLRVLLRMLRDCNLWDRTTLILTSDHGEFLGEMHQGRQYWFHCGPPYQEMIRVPLIIRPADHLRGLVQPGISYDKVSLTDLTPTMLDLVGRSPEPDEFDGTSLAELCRGNSEPFKQRRQFYFSCEDERDDYLLPQAFGGALDWGDSGKAIFNPRTLELREYYDLKLDGAEQDNAIERLSPGERAKIQEAIEAYHEELAFRAHHPPAEEFVNNNIVNRLAALGYVDA